MRILLVGKEFKPITPRLFRVRVGLGTYFCPQLISLDRYMPETGKLVEW